MAESLKNRLRLLHLADVHLDTPFYGREESVRNKLRAGARQAFTSAVDLAVDRRVHGLLIAGDLFDNDLLTFATEKFLLGEMVRLLEAGIPVFYATGNHDPGRANYRAHQLEWPENVRLFRSGSPETVRIGDAGYLTAAGHSTRGEAGNIASGYGMAREDRPHVAMLHTQVMSAAGAERHERYAPCSYEDLARPGFDYWALGHVHVRQRLFDDLPAWYLGNLQGRNPRETGQKGALYVEIEKGSVPEPEFVPLAPVLWETIEVESPPEPVTLDDFAEAVASRAAAKIQVGGGFERFIRLDLLGKSALARELGSEENIRELERDLEEKLDVSRVEVRPRRVSRPVDVQAYRGSVTVLGKVLELLEQAAYDDDLMGKIRPAELVMAVDDELSYLRGLLEGAGLMAAESLVTEERNP